MVVLSYGFKLPQTGDKGSVWFPALESNISQLNSHSHNGSDSAPISSAYVEKGSVAVLAANWISNDVASYKQDVTCPTGFNMDDYTIQVRLTGSHIVHPTVERLTSTTFRIYALSNTIAYTVVFR